MKRGRRNSKGAFGKWRRQVTAEELREIRNKPHYEEILIAIFQAMKLPVEHWATVFVLQDFGNGRTEFEATDDEIAAHWAKVMREGRLQAFLRKSNDGAPADHCAEVERVISSLEADFL